MESELENKPNELTSLAMDDAKEGRDLETLDLKNLDEFITGL